MKFSKFIKIAGLISIFLGIFCFFNVNSGYAYDIEFKPAIPIPGLPLQDGKIIINPGTLGEYIAALYKFFVGALAIVAVVIIMIAGFRWLFAGGSSERVGSAKEMISNSIVGLVIALTSYLLFNMLNPGLVNYQPLAVNAVPQEEFGSDVVSGAEVFQDTGGIQGIEFLSTISEDKWQQETTEALNYAAELYAAKVSNDPEKPLIIISGTRSITFQRYLYDKICGNATSCNKVCGPGPNNDFASCPHVRGVAVDIWHNGREINSDMVAAMKEAGFCQLSYEPWHFEKPKVSSACN